MTKTIYTERERKVLRILIDKLLAAYDDPYLIGGVKGAGICRLFYCTHLVTKTITSAHKELFVQYLEENLPKGISKYNWPKGETTPRIEWLRSQLKNLR